MEVRPEFKQTEVGVIPSDWEIATLDSVVLKFQNGYAFPSDGYVGSGVPIITMAQIGLSGLFQFDEESVNYWPSEKADELKDFVVSFGDIIIAMTDVTPQKNLIGRMTCVNKHGPFLLNQRVGLLKLDKQKIDSRFICALSNSSFWRSYSRGVATLGVQANIGTKELKSGKIPLPPIVEQRIIATALSDVDALLESLDRLIAKKRDLKKAAMQQLLTGQTRLLGFSGDWEVTKLSALADIRSGGTPSTGEPSFWDGDIPWCTPTDITALNGYKYLGETARKITSLGLNASSAEMIPAKSVVMTSRATIGECSINLVPVSTNQGFKNFVPHAKTDVDFLFYLLGTQKMGFISLCGGSTFLEIGKTQLAAYEVWIPSAKAEQTAIAEVLSAMDEELAVLEQRRNKTEALKQGMMQELLTGRTRLVSEKEEA